MSLSLNPLLFVEWINELVAINFKYISRDKFKEPEVFMAFGLASKVVGGELLVFDGEKPVGNYP
jgi:hypothetical protein